jgi:hypothetical protein
MFVSRLESPEAVRFAGERVGLQLYVGRDHDDLYLLAMGRDGGSCAGAPSWTLEIQGVACIQSSAGSDDGVFTTCGIVPDTTTAVCSGDVRLDITNNVFAAPARWPLMVETPDGTLSVPLPPDQFLDRLGRRYPEIRSRLEGA